MSESETALDDLKKMVIGQKTVVLPIEPSTPRLAGLHDSISAYDRLVSETVIAIIQRRGGKFPKAQLRALQAEVESALASYDGQTGRELESYRKYKQRLDQIIDLAEKAAE